MNRQWNRRHESTRRFLGGRVVRQGGRDDARLLPGDRIVPGDCPEEETPSSMMICWIINPPSDKVEELVKPGSGETVTVGYCPNKPKSKRPYLVVLYRGKAYLRQLPNESRKDWLPFQDRDFPLSDLKVELVYPMFGAKGSPQIAIKAGDAQLINDEGGWVRQLEFA